MDKKGLIGLIVVFVILLVVGFFLFVNEIDSEGDLVCVPASCCHATACVLESEAPNCSDRLCSMSCETDLDCGVGRCEYVEEKCEVVLNE